MKKTLTLLFTLFCVSMMVNAAEKFVPANASLNSTFFAQTGSWDVDASSTGDYNSSTGVCTIHIGETKNQQWKAQFKLNEGFSYVAGKYYDFSIKFHASNGIGGVTVKADDNNGMLLENASITLPADLDYTFTKTDVAGLDDGNGIMVFDFGWAPANTDITISEISIIEKDEPSVVTSYCRFATGHLGNAEFGDVNGRILLTLRKVNDSSVRVKVEPNNNGNDYFDVMKVELNGVPQEMGTVGGPALTDMEFVINGLASLNFSINVLWHNHNWADVNGRWTTQAFNVLESELCTETTALTIGSEYCCYYGNETKSGSHYAALTWETNEDGDVVITICEGPGEHNTAFRGNGLGDNLNGFTVLSGDGFATSEPASNYFNRVYGGAGTKTYTLQKKGGVTLPSPAKIHFQNKPFEWLCDENNNAYTNPTFEYTYGTICEQLAAPTNVAVSADSVITFNTVTGASKYTAYVYLNDVEKYKQEVASGDVLHFWPYEDGDYHVNVVAWGTGKTESDPSTDYVWSLEERTVVLGNSEYCEHVMQASTNTEAAFTWKTDDSGNIVITISETLGGAANATHFRGNALALANFKVGAGQTAGSNYFSHPGTTTGNQLVLTATTAPALGEKIYYHGVVEYATSKDGNAWPTLDFEWTYGTECAGIAVSAASNNTTMGTAVVKKGDEVVTSVENGDEVSFIATVTDSENYSFVNWTKGGVEVSTNATYVTTITETTNLVANFDYIRNTYCHYEVVSNASAVQGKKLYITVGALGGGQYQIKFEGSAEAPLTGLNNANYTINWVTTDIVDGDKKMSGQDVPFNNARWAFDASGYGSATATFGIAEGHTWEDIHVWNHAIYFSTASGELGYTSFPERYHIAWTEQCADAEAPVMAAPVGAALNTTDVRLTLSATDNWEGTITYNVNYKPVGDTGDGIDVTPAPTGASGEEISVDVLGLTTNTSYIFTVTAKDAANNTCDAQSCTVTPAGDVTAPTNVTVSAMALTDHIVRLTLYADDDFAGDITYNIAYDNAGVASTSAAQGTTTTLDIAGLDADADYHFVVVATDAANNSAAAVNADVVHTYAANLALNKPTYADVVALPKADGNDGNKNSRWASGGGAIHGADADSQDWWYVDFGAVYDIKNIRMYWEGARPSKYKFFTSYDAVTWTEIANMTTSPRVGNTDANVNEYYNDIANDAQGRYLKVWGYEDTNNNWAYGISFWELEAYGTLAVDAVAPVITNFTASGSSTTSVLLQATADDNFKGELTYTFYCDDVAQPNPIVLPAGQEASYAVTGLMMGNSYNFKVNVSDGIFNTMSDVVVASPVVDNEAPTGVMVSTKAVTDTTITLTLTATDNLGGMIYYTVTQGATVKNVQAVSGADVDVLFDGLMYDTEYSFSVVAKDGSDNSADAVVYAETTAPSTHPVTTAPVPTHHPYLVRSVYSDAYESALAHDFSKNTWTGIPYTEKNIDGDHFLVYTSNPSAQTQMPDVAWGDSNDGANAIIAKVGFNDGTNKGLDVRSMDYIHFDIWSRVATTYPELRLNDTQGGHFSLDGNGWQSFDMPLSGLTDEQKTNIRWIKFIGLRTPNPEEIAIDNVYFYEAPDHARTGVTVGGIGTICLPYDVTAEDRRGGTFYRADYQGSGFVYFLEETGTLNAGQAYIFVAEEEAIRLWYSGSEVLTPLDGAEARGFYGTFTDMAAGSLPDKYVIASNKLRRCGAGATLSANRAYIDLTEVPTTPLVVNDPANAPVRRRLGVGGNNGAATDLENVFQLNAEGTQKLILNGQLYILRDGHLYNAQGAAVK